MGVEGALPENLGGRRERGLAQGPSVWPRRPRSRWERAEWRGWGGLCPLSEASLWQVAHAYGGTRAAPPWKPTRVWGPAYRRPEQPKARQAAKASPGKGSSAKARAKPLSARRSPSRAGSLLVYCPTQRWPARTKARQVARASPACAVKVAPGCEGVARQGSTGGEASAERRGGEKQSLPAGRSSGRAGSPPLVRGPAPAPVCAAEGARLQRRRQVRSERRTEGPSHAGEGAASPNQAKPRSGREVSRVESCPEPACALECVPKAERRWRVPCLSKPRQVSPLVSLGDPPVAPSAHQGAIAVKTPPGKGRATLERLAVSATLG